jgi:regulator of protease activity HflC (stomatin/prohibitin superfamily)
VDEPLDVVALEVAALPPGPPPRKSRFERLAEWKDRHELGLTIGVLVFAFVCVYFFRNIVISVHSGEMGVQWSRIFGTEANVVYPEGIHLIVPWNTMFIYNMRYQKLDRTVRAMSKDGLDIDVDITVRFRPELKNLTRLHQQVGPDYAEIVIVPQSSAAVRAVIGRYRPDELYTASFVTIQNDVAKLTREAVRNRFVFIDDVMIRTITMPKTVADAIQRKLEQEQASLEMHYRVDRERQEAERKRIEAEGIRDFQQTVSSTISDKLLQFKGIEATLQLAQSPNSKVIVIGGKDGLPVILNPDAGASPAPPRPQPPGR